ncbi:uncharacterized protein LOC116430911 isoform X2 [Nomia melanderi]|uniref:uncharacterized protein LOC116430911 isoform X2 n=1 Tax=Nomia melanderi TaxID=2448451 RepID=UPI0013040378|nr:keratin-associated protein 19-2-like isoform X2 [Nomia melanderi]
MQPLLPLQVLCFACVIALSSGAIKTSEPKLITKLAPVNSPSYDDSTKDLTASASDRTFHISKDYGQPGYGGSVPYGSYYGSIYGPGAGYRGAGYNLGHLNTGYRGYPAYSPSGIVGNGHVGYGYYGNAGYNPNYGGYGYGSGYGGYGSGLGYGGYSPYNTGSYGLGYDDGYNGYGRGGYGRYGGYDAYGYGSGYGGSNYGSVYGTRSNYEPYTYHGSGYGSYSYPSGYRGYS